jgi:hypothetical protein
MISAQFFVTKAGKTGTVVAVRHEAMRMRSKIIHRYFKDIQPAGEDR